MGRELIVFATRNGVLSSLEDADELVLYNMDTGERSVVGNPYREGYSRLEEFFEERDPSIMIVSGISEEDAFLAEENGVHVISHRPTRIDELIDELFLKRGE